MSSGLLGCFGYVSLTSAKLGQIGLSASVAALPPQWLIGLTARPFHQPGVTPPRPVARAPYHGTTTSAGHADRRVGSGRRATPRTVRRCPAALPGVR